MPSPQAGHPGAVARICGRVLWWGHVPWGRPLDRFFSIYPCLILATQLLGIWHSLPETSDAISHHSPSLWEREMGHPEGLRLQDGGKRHRIDATTITSQAGHWSGVQRLTQEGCGDAPLSSGQWPSPCWKGSHRGPGPGSHWGLQEKERAQHSLGSTSPEPATWGVG